MTNTKPAPSGKHARTLTRAERRNERRTAKTDRRTRVAEAVRRFAR